MSGCHPGCSEHPSGQAGAGPDERVGGAAPGALSLLTAKPAQARRDLGERLCTDWPHTAHQALWVWQDVDRKGPWEPAGRSDSERAEGREEQGRRFSAELLDVKLGMRPSKGELWLRSQTSSSQSCQTPDQLSLQALPDITTHSAERPGDKGSSPSAEPSPKPFQGFPLPSGKCLSSLLEGPGPSPHFPEPRPHSPSNPGSFYVLILAHALVVSCFPPRELVSPSSGSSKDMSFPHLNCPVILWCSCLPPAPSLRTRTWPAHLCSARSDGTYTLHRMGAA